MVNSANNTKVYGSITKSLVQDIIKDKEQTQEGALDINKAKISKAGKNALRLDYGRKNHVGKKIRSVNKIETIDNLRDVDIAQIINKTSRKFISYKEDRGLYLNTHNNKDRSRIGRLFYQQGNQLNVFKKKHKEAITGLGNKIKTMMKEKIVEANTAKNGSVSVLKGKLEEYTETLKLLIDQNVRHFTSFIGMRKTSGDIAIRMAEVADTLTDVLVQQIQYDTLGTEDDKENIFDILKTKLEFAQKHNGHTDINNFVRNTHAEIMAQRNDRLLSEAFLPSDIDSLRKSVKPLKENNIEDNTITEILTIRAYDVLVEKIRNFPMPISVKKSIELANTINKFAQTLGISKILKNTDLFKKECIVSGAEQKETEHADSLSDAYMLTLTIAQSRIKNEFRSDMVLHKRIEQIEQDSPDMVNFLQYIDTISEVKENSISFDIPTKAVDVLNTELYSTKVEEDFSALALESYCNNLDTSITENTEPNADTSKQNIDTLRNTLVKAKKEKEIQRVTENTKSLAGAITDNKHKMRWNRLRKGLYNATLGKTTSGQMVRNGVRAAMLIAGGVGIGEAATAISSASETIASEVANATAHITIDAIGNSWIQTAIDAIKQPLIESATSATIATLTAEIVPNLIMGGTSTLGGILPTDVASSIRRRGIRQKKVLSYEGIQYGKHSGKAKTSKKNVGNMSLQLKYNDEIRAIQEPLFDINLIQDEFGKKIYDIEKRVWDLQSASIKRTTGDSWGKVSIEMQTLQDEIVSKYEEEKEANHNLIRNNKNVRINQNTELALKEIAQKAMNKNNEIQLEALFHECVDKKYIAKKDNEGYALRNELGSDSKEEAVSKINAGYLLAEARILSGNNDTIAQKYSTIFTDCFLSIEDSAYTSTGYKGIIDHIKEDRTAIGDNISALNQFAVGIDEKSKRVLQEIVSLLAHGSSFAIARKYTRNTAWDMSTQANTIEGDNTTRSVEDVNTQTDMLQSQKNNISSKSTEPVIVVAEATRTVSSTPFTDTEPVTAAAEATRTVSSASFTDTEPVTAAAEATRTVSSTPSTDTEPVTAATEVIPATSYKIRETSNMESDTVEIYKEKLINIHKNMDRTPASYDTLIESILEECKNIKDENSNKKAQLQELGIWAILSQSKCRIERFNEKSTPIDDKTKKEYDIEMSLCYTLAREFSHNAMNGSSLEYKKTFKYYQEFFKQQRNILHKKIAEVHETYKAYNVDVVRKGNNDPDTIRHRTERLFRGVDNNLEREKAIKVLESYGEFLDTANGKKRVRKNRLQ